MLDGPQELGRERKDDRDASANRREVDQHKTRGVSDGRQKDHEIVPSNSPCTKDPSRNVDKNQAVCNCGTRIVHVDTRSEKNQIKPIADVDARDFQVPKPTPQRRERGDLRASNKRGKLESRAGINPFRRFPRPTIP